jgi:DNA-binding CsgD family transcriptional regulator
MTDTELYWTTARSVCNPRQLEVLQLSERGLGRRRIALLLRISPDHARDLLNRARQKTAEALEELDQGDAA